MQVFLYEWTLAMQLVPQVSIDVPRVQVFPEPPKEAYIEPHVSNTPPLEPGHSNNLPLNLQSGTVKFFLCVKLIEWGHEEAYFTSFLTTRRKSALVEDL